MAFLKLIRWPNLLIVAFTQFLVYYKLLLPTYQESEQIPVLNTTTFSCLVIITLIITAGGYIINDILDLAIDKVNKPDRMVLGNEIQIQTASWFYSLLGFVGFILAVALALYTDRIQLLWIYPSALLLLYYYSLRLKKSLLWGNLLVALFCAGVAGIVWVAEWDGYQALSQLQPEKGLLVKSILSWYMVFAFLSTLYRELIKDLEDIKGDQFHNSKSLPIVIGKSKTKMLAAILCLLLLGLLAWQIIFFKAYFLPSALYFLIPGILLPLLFSMAYLWKAQEAKHFHRLSQLAKLIILDGVVLLFFLS